VIERRVRDPGGRRRLPGSRLLGGRIADRLMAAPRRAAGESSLGPILDGMGGEVLRLRARDGLRLSARWMPVEDGSAWSPDPHEAILLLHGWSGSVAPDVVEYGPFLRLTAGVLGLDFRGHGGSDAAPATFGAREVEDVAGALAWLGERGIGRVALFGTSMGAITALASVVILGDGSLPAADADPSTPAATIDAPRPRIVGVVADSAVSRLSDVLGDRLPGPLRLLVAAFALDELARRVGADPRETEPIRVVGLVDPVPLLLIHGANDRRTPPGAVRALAAAAGRNAEQWTVPGGGHSGAHRADPDAYEQRVTAFLRRAFLAAREADPIIARSSAAPAVDPAALTRSTP
jgi:pimeloyl-ACP methyl ester carboxylesterase